MQGNGGTTGAFMLLQKAGGGFPSHIHQAPLVFKPGHKPRWCWQGEKCAIPGGAWHASLWESNANSSGQGHPGVPAEGQTMLPTSLLQRQQQTRAFCWLLGVRSVTKTLVESLPEGTGCQVRAKMPPGCPQRGEREASMGILAPFPAILLSPPHFPQP